MDETTWRGYSAAGPAAARALRHGGRPEVRAALLAARDRTLALADELAAALGPACPVPYAEERNPPLWELGHVAWFQEWWLARNPGRHLGAACAPELPRPPSILPGADTCYDSGRVAHASRWSLPLPDAAGTRDYLARTLERTLELLDALPPAPGDDALYFFRLTALHEAMHAEAAIYMAQGLGVALRQAAPLQMPPHQELELKAQRFTLGAGPDGFAFDNELQPRQVDVAALRIDAHPVSWARFLPFVEAGGHEDARWWSDDGRAWLATLPHRHPAWLRQSAGGWQHWRGGRWLRLRPEEAALHLNAHEAEAWCRWAGRRLPTEAEWECAALTLPGFGWGAAWEWTASPFEPYPGFVPHPYRDYSVPWFGSRRVLRGASEATAPALADARYRNFFVPHRRDIPAGFRSCRAP